MTPRSDAGAWSGLDALPDAAVVVDVSGRIRYANPAAARLAGVVPSDLVGAPAAAGLPLADARGRDWWRCARPLEADPTVVSRIPETDLTLFPQGRGRPVTLTAARNGRDPGAELVVCLRRGEHRRRAADREADIAAALSHDLRSPLTTVKGFAKTLLSRDDRLTADQRREMLAAVVADADRLTRLIVEAVDALRIHAGRLGLRRRAVTPGELVDRALAGLAEDDLARVRVTGPEREAAVDCDLGRLAGGLSTVLETALAGDGDVQLHHRVEGRLLYLHVTAPQARPPVAAAALFGPRIGPDRQAIRRWVARGVVEAHGGRIEAPSPPDGGVALVLTVPLATPGDARRQGQACD